MNRPICLLLTFLSGLSLLGCASGSGGEPASRSVRIDPATLATSPPVHPDAQWRVRIPLGSEPRADHICRLCDQYELIEIKTQAQWQAFCEQTGLDDANGTPDFDRGIVVGLVARVGESADGFWPTSISEVRLQGDGAGWLRSRFRTGVYRPLLVDAYCNLAYVNGLRRVILVEINRRAYLTAQ